MVADRVRSDLGGQPVVVSQAGDVAILFAAFGLQTDGTFALVDPLQFGRGWPDFGVVEDHGVQDGRGSG